MMKKPLSGPTLLSTALLAASSALSPAALNHLEMMQASNGNLAFQYAFEGSDDGTRLADGSANGYTLQRVAGGSGGSTDDIQFVSGFDGSSQAYRPAADSSDRAIGAGLNTESTEVSIGQIITVEAVIQLDAFNLSAPAYVVSARSSGGRGYFFRQNGDGSDDGRLFTTLGDTFGDELNAYAPYSAGDWYYVALVADVTSGTSQVNLFGANLTAGETDVTLLASDSSLFTGDWSGTSQIGVGNFTNGTQEYLAGAIDNLALTNEALSESEINDRLDALLLPIPEPSSALLAAGALLCLLPRRQR
ncbi:LamG-like jellyroll fold domain-containing protein [Roseibacillus ishigakijimensis]|uniref:PEP-CTERM protein-sorting domain-containing protein n=1 Tax=Roseibacillus ishigakijimensis TaxID=454146 RepID=A0A934RUM6_9BACT|nr:LamG-like jellyroll fold domain-containing protein [Roseibacillus ishigakijimensis]MBK1835314.1 hypothetical protein [Roseibacillus ishigakijimensis]